MKAYNIKSSVSDKCSVPGRDVCPGTDTEHYHEKLVRGGEVKSILMQQEVKLIASY